MRKPSLIGRKTYKYNDNITIVIPTLNMVRGDNGDDENAFWEEVNLFTATPDAMMSELDSMGVDFETMSNYSLFMFLLLSCGKDENTRNFLFQGFNLYGLDIKSEEDGDKPELTLVDEYGRTIFDESIYNDVSDIICDMVGHKKEPRMKFGNAFAKKKRIEHDRKKKEKLRNSKSKENANNTFDSIILRLVCNANFPYNFETIGDVTIVNIIYGLKQIEKDIQVTDLIQSRLVGVDLTKQPKESLSRFVL